MKKKAERKWVNPSPRNPANEAGVRYLINSEIWSDFFNVEQTYESKTELVPPGHLDALPHPDVRVARGPKSKSRLWISNQPCQSQGRS